MSIDIRRDSKLRSGINLIVIQLGLYLIPLVTVPYIVRTVGIENYGKYAFFQAVMGLLAVVGNYGFVQTGVRDISVSENIATVNLEFSNIFYSKFVAFLAAFVIGLALLSFSRFSAESELYIYSLLYLVPVLLDTSFVYQGIEKLKDFVNVNIVGSVATLLIMLWAIREEGDYRYLPAVFNVPRIIVYLISILLLYLRYRISPIKLDLAGVREKMRSNLNFFTSNIFIILYTRATSVFLGLFTNDTYVGYYTIADQLTYAYSNIQGKVSTVYQPQAIQAFKNGLLQGRALARESVLAVSIIAASGFLFTQFFAGETLSILFKAGAHHSEIPLRILSLNFITIHLSSIFGMQILLALYKDKDILKPSIYAALFNITVGCASIYFYKDIGAAASMAAIEFFIFMYFYIKVRKYGIDVFDSNLFRRLFNFTFSMVLILIILKSIYRLLDMSVFLKFPALILLYGLCIIAALKLLKMVDFRKRKILVERAAVE